MDFTTEEFVKIMKLTFKKLDEKAIIPSRATPASAGLDIHARVNEPVVLAPNEIKMIPTGLTAMTDCDDVALLIYPRSGVQVHLGLVVLYKKISHQIVSHRLKVFQN